MIKKVLLDMDGVLTNFHKGVCDAFEHPYELERMTRFDFWEDWLNKKITRDDVNEVCGWEFWADLEWHEEGKEIINTLAEAYGKENVFLLTCPMPNTGSWTGKKIWIERMAPDYLKRLIITHASKAIFASPETLLIDDKNENVDDFIRAGGNAILVPRPWNRLRRHKVISHLEKAISELTVSDAIKGGAVEATEMDKEQVKSFFPEAFSDSEIKADVKKQFPVSLKEYMSLSDAYDKHSRTLMIEKGEEYAVKNDFLCMENRLAGMMGDEPEKVSLIMAGKHITSLGIILEKQVPEEINLAKWDERIRDGMNLLKITAAFIHAKQNDFSLHLGKKKCPENAPQA